MVNKKRVIFHGEVAFFEVDVIPVDAEKVDTKGKAFIVGESETHGNSHNVLVNDLTKVFAKEDIVFLETLGTEIYCPNIHRHDTIELPPGKWMVGHASEYDYFSESLKKVRD